MCIRDRRIAAVVAAVDGLSSESAGQRARASFARGRALDAGEAYSNEAEVELSRAVKLAPDFIDAWNALGHASAAGAGPSLGWVRGRGCRGDGRPPPWGLGGGVARSLARRRSALRAVDTLSTGRGSSLPVRRFWKKKDFAGARDCFEAANERQANATSLRSLSLSAVSYTHLTLPTKA